MLRDAKQVVMFFVKCALYLDCLDCCLFKCNYAICIFFKAGGVPPVLKQGVYLLF